MTKLKVTDITRGSTLGEQIELADTSLTRLFGLLGRKALDAGAGLWIKPSSGVHTFFMTFSIDVIGLDSDLNVIKLWHAIPPFRVTSVSMKVKSVIELPAGAIRNAGVEVGDRLAVQPSSNA
jgi:uncharacterized protein